LTKYSLSGEMSRMYIMISLFKGLFKGLDKRPIRRYYQFMTTISISQLKTNPSSVIAQAADYPVVIENRNKTQAYLVGKALFEKIIALLEEKEDIAAVKNTDFSKGRNFDEVAKELGV